MLKLIDRQTLNIVAFKTRAQMNELVQDGHAIKSCYHCGATNEHRKLCIAPGVRHVWTFRATDLFFQRDGTRTSASLTAHDSRANAGIGGRLTILRARLRVGWWPLIVSDPRNPLPMRIPMGAMCPIPVTRQPLPRLV